MGPKRFPLLTYGWRERDAWPSPAQAAPFPQYTSNRMPECLKGPLQHADRPSVFYLPIIQTACHSQSGCGEQNGSQAAPASHSPGEAAHSAAPVVFQAPLVRAGETPHSSPILGSPLLPLGPPPRWLLLSLDDGQACWGAAWTPLKCVEHAISMLGIRRKQIESKQNTKNFLSPPLPVLPYTD
ncbi:unnamed protein product [Gadus morhua 'NCC']